MELPMKTLFKVLRFLTTFAILTILIKSFGIASWKTWVIYALTYLAMLFDFLADMFDDKRNL